MSFIQHVNDLYDHLIFPEMLEEKEDKLGLYIRNLSQIKIGRKCVNEKIKQIINYNFSEWILNGKQEEETHKNEDIW